MKSCMYIYIVIVLLNCTVLYDTISHQVLLYIVKTWNQITLYHTTVMSSVYICFFSPTVVLTHIQSDVTHRSVSRSSLGQENLIHVDQGNKIFGFAAIAILGFDTSWTVSFFCPASHGWFHVATTYICIYKYI